MFASLKGRGCVPLTVLLCFLFVCATTNGQTTQATPQPEPRSLPTQKPSADVVRVYTDVVQSVVMVFDEQGHIVDGLTKTDVELRIDSKQHQIEAFEKNTAG